CGARWRASSSSSTSWRTPRSRPRPACPRPSRARPRAARPPSSCRSRTWRLLNGAPEKESPLEGVDDWLEYKERYDENLASKANRVLSDILGPARARVEIDSLWSFEQSTT